MLSMENERLVRNWHKAILTICRERLGRELTEQENFFVTSRGGFIALEMIEDSVRTLPLSDLERYLNSKK